MSNTSPIWIINHSGGKDSQAMYLYVTRVLQVPHDSIYVVHADLPGVDWEGIVDHIKSTIEHDLIVTSATKTFHEMVRRRRMFPSPNYRQCTSDLKRGPIEKIVRSVSKEANSSIIINCMGIRAQESYNRAKKQPFKFIKRNSKAGRIWFDYLPIFRMTQKEVFQIISDSGQKPFWTYSKGMKRVSCRFCIMACENDIKIAARLAPEAFEEMARLEEEINYTMFNGITLREKILE